MISLESLPDIEIKRGPFEFENMVEFLKPFLRMCGWQLSPVAGLYHGEKDIQACPIAIVPSAIYCNLATGRERIQLDYWKYGHWQRKIVDRDVICNSTKIVGLANYGVEVTSSNANVLSKALNEIIINSLDTIRVYKSTSHLGWCGQEFVPFSGTVVFDAESEYGSLTGCVCRSGTAEEWVKYMAPLLKDIRLRLTVAAAFASPIIEVIGQLPFVLHLWGKSGTGKTVASMCAASVWGDPSKGRYLKSLNSTVNALLTTAAVLKNLPLVADELQTIRCSNENFDKLIMTLTEGSNRGRMNRSRMEDTLSWSNCFILNGEQPITSSGSGGGAINRCLQLEVCSNLMPSGQETAKFVQEHFGSVGMEYISRLNFDYARDVYGSISETLTLSAERRGLQSTNKQLAAMALLMTGDELMREFFFPDSLELLTPDDVIPYLTEAKEVDIAERAYEYIVNVISANSMAFTEKANESWGKRGTGNTVYVNNTVLERELKRGGFEFGAVKRSWAENGFIIKNGDRYRHSVTVWGHSTSCTLLVLPKSEDDD